MYVYFICGEDSGRPTKIGVATEPAKRLAQLQTGNPEKLVIWGLWWMESRDSAFTLEWMIHKVFDHLRLSGEWFATSANACIWAAATLLDEADPREHNWQNSAVDRVREMLGSCAGCGSVGTFDLFIDPRQCAPHSPTPTCGNTGDGKND